MIPKPLRISRNADLVFALPDTTLDVELERIRAQLRDHFSGQRVLVIRGDAAITSIERRHKRPYRPSMMAHGG